MLWRQGDIFIETAAAIPIGAAQQPHLVLAEGEITGHSHRVADLDTAVLYEWQGEYFLQVIAKGAQVIHEEHGTVDLGRGTYRVWRQREYDPAVNRRAQGPSRFKLPELPREESSRFVFD